MTDELHKEIELRNNFLLNIKQNYLYTIQYLQPLPTLFFGTFLDFTLALLFQTIWKPFKLNWSSNKKKMKTAFKNLFAEIVLENAEEDPNHQSI